MVRKTSSRLLTTFAAVLVTATIGMGFGWLHTIWFHYSPDSAADVLGYFAMATLAVAMLFLVGQLLGLRSHAYFIIVSGAAFLAVDIAVWWRFGITPGNKSYQDGFVPAAIMGIFLGPLYKIIAPAPYPQDRRH